MDSSAFGQQTTVEPDPLVPGRYGTVVSDQWNAPLLPHGGVVTALALRAMAAELATPEQSLRSVTTVFAAQVPPGPVDVDVVVLRRGRTMSQATATVRPVGASTGHVATAVFGTSRRGFEFTDVTCPTARPPEQCPSFRDPLPEGVTGFPPASFWERVESRVAMGHAPWHRWEPTSSERIYWYRFDDPPVDDEGQWDPLALVALCDTMPGAVGERMGPDMPAWFGPSADLTVHVLGRATSPWLLSHNRARFAGDGYASVEMELWDPERGLVAFATQVMFFSFPDGIPPGRRLTPPSL
ncbi:MAG TPA: thioesterase family protein [Acidimicrobiales bacterium]|nr:thioesterase family protein [Acidimicrobiales bacterium]